MTKKRKGNPIVLKHADEIEVMRQNGDILGRMHAEVARLLKPGITTIALDKLAYEFIKDNGGRPSFLHYNGYKYSLCISVNEQVVHGIPGPYVVKEGDIISIDGGVEKDGYHADSAYTYAVGEVPAKTQELLEATHDSLLAGISECIVGNTVGDIANTIQTYVQSKGFSVVRELVGHGIGSKLHEGPEVPNYGKRKSLEPLAAGMVIAIEPMINLGVKQVVLEADEWTFRTLDRKPSAHFEHTVAITDKGPDILTTFKYIEEVYTLKK